MMNSSVRTGTRLAALVLLGATSLAALAQPNLVVRVDGQVLANHTELSMPPATLGESTQLVVVLRNESSETLEFTEEPPIMIGGGFPDQFELVQPALESGNTLSPNGSTAFLVRFNPTLSFENPFTHVYIWTNASAVPFHLIIRGQTLSPRMVVRYEGEEIPDLGKAVFPTTEVGDVFEAVFTIENEGSGPLELTGDPLVTIFGGFDFDFAVTQQPDAVIPAGGASEFRVAFAPTLERLYHTRLFINVNENSAAVNTLYDIDIEAQSMLPVNDETGQEQNGDDGVNDGTGDDTGNDNANDGQDDVGNDDGFQNDADDNFENDGGADDLNDEQFEDQLDNEDQLDDSDELTEEDQENLESLESLSPGGNLCGFGVGLASLMSMVSLGGARVHGRRSRNRRSRNG